MSKISYRCRNGEKRTFEVSREACEPFGFYHKDRVITPKGEATVIGVNDNALWFHIQGDDGAAFWKKGWRKEKFREKGFRLIRSAENNSDDDPGFTVSDLLEYSANIQIGMIRDLDVNKAGSQNLIAELARRSGQWEVRQEAAKLLNPDIHGETLEYLILNDNDPDVVVAARNRFDLRKHTANLLRVADAKGDKNLLAEVLEYADWEESGDLLVKMAISSDYDWRIRLEAVKKLHPIRHADTLRHAIDYDRDEDVVAAAQKRLAEADSSQEETDHGECVNELPPSEKEVIELDEVTEEPVSIESEEEKQENLEAERQEKLAQLEKETKIRKIVKFCTHEADDVISLAALKKLDPSIHASLIEKCLKRGSEAVQLATLKMIDPKLSSYMIGKLSLKTKFDTVKLEAIKLLDPVQHRNTLEKIIRKNSGEVKEAAKSKLAA